MSFTVTQAIMVNLWLSLDSVARVRSDDDKTLLVFVSGANAHHSEWLKSVFQTNRHGPDAVDFWNLSGCEQLFCCPTYIAGNRLDLAMTAPPWHSWCARWYPTGHLRSLLCHLRASCLAICSGVKCQKHRTNWDMSTMQSGALHGATFWNHIIHGRYLTGLSARSLVEMFPPTFCLVYLETSNSLMSAGGELMMLSRLLIILGIKHSIQFIEVDFYVPVLRPRVSMVVQGSHIMYTTGIIWGTPPIHIRGLRHWKDRFGVWNLLFLLLEHPEVVWWWLLPGRPHWWLSVWQ